MIDKGGAESPQTHTGKDDVASGRDSVRAAPHSGQPDMPLPAGARAMLRWLPTAEPSGAFAGQHDRVHCPQREVHSRVNLWWSDRVVHPGERVGPPRGGLVPGPDSTYAVALPAGGYLWIESDHLIGWRAQSMPGHPLIRADGQCFDPGRYSSVHPYFQRHYNRMTESSIRASVATMGHDPVQQSDVARVMAVIAGAGDPVVCTCTGRDRTGPLNGWGLGLVVPESLLVDSGTLRVLVGESDVAEASATLWRLSAMVWDPARVGRALAAEAAARNSGEPARGWPQAPITEQAVAHIAAQAIRHNGAALVRSMPAWLLGWVMVARPVLAGIEAQAQIVASALNTADRVRVARVETQWHAMAAARALLNRSSAELHRLDDPDELMWTPAAGSVDLRAQSLDVRPDQSDEPAGGLGLREAVRLAYHCDVRSWFGVIAEHG